MKTIGERIKARREQLQLSQDELAKKLGYKSRSSINKIEIGCQNLKQSKIKAIADALETTPSYIMGWDDDSNTVNVLFNLLHTLYESIEEKSVVGSYEPILYYVVTNGPERFILHDKDMDTLKSLALSSVYAAVEKLKDDRPERTIIEEYEQELNSDSSKEAMRFALERYLKKHPENASYFAETIASLTPSETNKQVAARTGIDLSKEDWGKVILPDNVDDIP